MMILFILEIEVYKLTLQFGSILNKDKYNGVFKINFLYKRF